MPQSVCHFFSAETMTTSRNKQTLGIQNARSDGANISIQLLINKLNYFLIMLLVPLMEPEILESRKLKINIFY